MQLGINTPVSIWSLSIWNRRLQWSNVSCIDPGVRSVPLGTQDSIWGKPICLHGQIGTFALFQEALTLQHVRIFHDAGIDFMLWFLYAIDRDFSPISPWSIGANSTSLWNSEENSEAADFYSKVAVFLSARAYHNFVCTDLSPNRLFNGHTLAPFCTTWDVKVNFFWMSIADRPIASIHVTFVGLGCPQLHWRRTGVISYFGDGCPRKRWKCTLCWSHAQPCYWENRYRRLGNFTFKFLLGYGVGALQNIVEFSRLIFHF